MRRGGPAAEVVGTNGAATTGGGDAPVLKNEHAGISAGSRSSQGRRGSRHDVDRRVGVDRALRGRGIIRVINCHTRSRNMRVRILRAQSATFYNVHARIEGCETLLDVNSPTINSG